jgi:hypothetical protein
VGVVGWLRKRTSRLRFWAAAARKNCSRTNFNLRRRLLYNSPLRPMPVKAEENQFVLSAVYISARVL